MQQLYPKDFISQVLIDEMRDVVTNHTYLAFCLIASGIEFLGKCYDTGSKEFNTVNSISSDGKTPYFDLALDNLFPKKYGNKDLRDKLRNGLLHFYAPKKGMALTEIKHDKTGELPKSKHPHVNKRGEVTLVIEYFFIDFVDACKKILKEDFTSDKMEKPFLTVPRND